jgi:hypothetical protein
MRIDEDSKIVWKIMDSLTAINNQKIINILYWGNIIRR